MYENVLQHKQNKVITYSTYCNVFQTENIGFSRPSQVECENCLSYKDCLVGPDHDSNNCAEYIAYAIHKEKYIQARIEYQNSIPDGVLCFNADMQRVMVLPKLTTKEHLFVRQLVTFNGTFASNTPG